MSLSIREREMSSSETCHRAVREWGSVDRWFVSWLDSGPALSRNEAITAMTLAEVVTGAVRPMLPDTWVLVTDLAGELGIGPDDARALILAPAPGDDAKGRRK
jgi:hypothetical protein